MSRNSLVSSLFLAFASTSWGSAASKTQSRAKHIFDKWTQSSIELTNHWLKRSELLGVSAVSHRVRLSSHRRLSRSATLYSLGIQRYTSIKSPAIEMQAHFRAIAKSCGLLARPFPSTYDNVIPSPRIKCRFPCPSFLHRTKCFGNEKRSFGFFQMNRGVHVLDTTTLDTMPQGRRKKFFRHICPLSSNNFVVHICEGQLARTCSNSTSQFPSPALLQSSNLSN